MAERRSDKKDEGPVRRQKLDLEGPKQQDPEKEQNLPEQERFGNSFMLDQMLGGGDRNHDGPPPPGAILEQGQLQDWGGIEDADGAPKRPAGAQDHWFRPRLRPKGNEEIETLGGDPDDPGIPPEDPDWLESLQGSGERWADRAPQPPLTALEGNLDPWLRALLPIAGPIHRQMAIAIALRGDASLQDPSGAPLLGVALTSAIGAVVAHAVGDTPAGRLRTNRGLAIAASPFAPQDPTRTAAQLAELGEPSTIPEVRADPWLARLIVNRLGLDRPPVPTLDDPPPPTEPNPDDPVDLDAIFKAELGTPPDPIEEIRRAALEACEAHARWGVSLRAGCAGIAVALIEAEVPPDAIAAALKPVDTQVAQAVSLLQEIAAAARSGTVAIRGLRNGLGRSARVLTGAHRAAVEGLMAAAAVPTARPQPPEPVSPEIAAAVQDGQALPEHEPHPLVPALVEAIADREGGRLDALGQALLHEARTRQDGVGVAAAGLLQMRACELAGKLDQARSLRDRLGAELKGAGGRAGLSLLARWEPSQVAAGL